MCIRDRPAQALHEMKHIGHFLLLYLAFNVHLQRLCSVTCGLLLCNAGHVVFEAIPLLTEHKSACERAAPPYACNLLILPTLLALSRDCGSRVGLSTYTAWTFREECLGNVLCF